MPPSELWLIKRCAEFRPRDQTGLIPKGTRGIYALLRQRPKLRKFDVVYLGMAAGGKAGVRARLKAHSRSRRKGPVWTHFSVFEVWDNVRQDDIEELEGLFRHIYRKDTRANRLNRQRKFRKLVRVRVNDLRKWNAKS